MSNPPRYFACWKVSPLGFGGLLGPCCWVGVSLLSLASEVELVSVALGETVSFSLLLMVTVGFNLIGQCVLPLRRVGGLRRLVSLLGSRHSGLLLGLLPQTGPGSLSLLPPSRW